MKEEETYVCPHIHPHNIKGSKPISQDVQVNMKCADEYQGDTVLAYPLLSGLVLDKVEHGGLLPTMGQPFPVQIAMEQRRKLRMMDTPYNHTTSGYPQPSDGHLRCGADAELQSKCKGDSTLLVGMGVGVAIPAQTSYVSLNFHKVLNKHASMKAQPFTTLSHITNHHNNHTKEISSYSSSPSPEGNREMPQHNGTSVIITNDR